MDYSKTKFTNMKEHKFTILISIGVVLIILVAPFIFTSPYYLARFNFSGTGSVGDTIGGLTAPFINGLAAILVFIAFREQVKANKLLVSRDQARDVLEQIKAIQENRNDQYPFEKTVGDIIDNADLMIAPSPDLKMTILLDRALYFLSEFVVAKELLERYNLEDNFIYNKLGYLYSIKYYAYIEKLVSSLRPRLGLPKNNHDGVIFEIVSTSEELNVYFDSIVGKYKVPSATEAK